MIRESLKFSGVRNPKPYKHKQGDLSVSELVHGLFSGRKLDGGNASVPHQPKQHMNISAYEAATPDPKC